MAIPVNALAIMAKAPVAGTVKTRLVPPLTEEQAAEFYRALLLDQLENLKSLACAERYVAYAPDDAQSIMQELAGADYSYLAQRGGDLGARMQNLCADLWQRGHRSIVLVGSDLPGLPVDFLQQAFAQLEGERGRVVLGPSADGGYYLIGMNQPAAEIFKNLTWSHERVLAQTTARLDGLGLSYGLLPAWFDLDVAEDFQRLRRFSDSEARRRLPRTFGCLERLGIWPVSKI